MNRLLLLLSILLTAGTFSLIGCRSDPNEFSRYDSDGHFFCSVCRHYHSHFHDHYYYAPETPSPRDPVRRPENHLDLPILPPP